MFLPVLPTVAMIKKDTDNGWIGKDNIESNKKENSNVFSINKPVSY